MAIYESQNPDFSIVPTVPKPVIESVSSRKSLNNAILDDIEGKLKFQEDDRKDFRFFNHQLNRKHVHYKYLDNNRTRLGDVVSVDPHKKHLKSLGRLRFNGGTY